MWIAAIGGFSMSKMNTIGLAWPKRLHRPHCGTNSHCLQSLQGGIVAGLHKTRGYLCRVFKILKLGSSWARAVFASGLLGPTVNQLLGQGKKDCVKTKCPQKRSRKTQKICCVDLNALGVGHNVKFLLEGVLLGKEFLPQLSNFSLLFNMHIVLEQLKMQKKGIIV